MYFVRLVTNVKLDILNSVLFNVSYISIYWFFVDRNWTTHVHTRIHTLDEIQNTNNIKYT